MGMFDEFEPVQKASSSGKGLFDEFDTEPTQQEDPNDFEAMTAKEKALLERRHSKRDIEDLEKRRYDINKREAEHGTSIGQFTSEGRYLATQLALINRLKKPGRADFSPKDLETADKRMKEIQPFLDKWKQKRGLEIQEYMKLPNWYDDPEIEGKLPKMFKSLGGSLVGGLVAPENFIPVGKGATITKTAIKGFLANAPIGAISDLASQQLDVELGLQPEIDWERVMMGGLTAGTIGGAVHTGVHHWKDILPGSRSGKAAAKAKKSIDGLNASVPKPRGDGLFDEFVGPPDPEGTPGFTGPMPKQDFVGPEAPFPPIMNEFDVPRPIEESQAKAVYEIESQKNLDEIMYGTEAAQQRPFPPAPRPSKLPDISKVMHGVPEVQPEVPPTANPKIENGFGPDLETTPLENAPFMPGRLAEQANVDEVPGSHEMQFLPNDKDAGAPLGISGEARSPYVDPKDAAAAVAQGLQGTHQMGFRKLGQTKKGKKESGALDLSAFVEGFKRVFGTSNKSLQTFAEKARAHWGHFPNLDALKAHIETNKFEDIPTDNFVMNNQLPVIATKNPVVSTVFNHLFDAVRAADSRIIGYDEAIKPARKWALRNSEQAALFLREWEKLNAQPQLRSLRQQIETQGYPALERHMASVGVGGETVKQMKPFMDVLQDIATSDGDFLLKHGRGLGYEPLYFPLARMGPYHFVVTNPAGEVVGAYGFRTLSEARKSWKTIKDAALPGYEVADVGQTNPARQLHPAMVEAMNNDAPTWLREAAANQYSKRAEYIRNFERGRNKNHEVKGWLGEIMPQGQKASHDLLEDYIELIGQRISESHRLQNSTAAVEVIRTLMKDGNIIQRDYPGTWQWMNSEISRHLGLDISKVGPLDQQMQKQGNRVGRLLTHVDGVLKGYKPGENDLVTTENSVRNLFRGFSYTASLFRIGLVPQVLAGNLVQNATISMDGVRNAYRLGVPLHVVATAQTKQLAYLANGGQYFPEVKAFMKKAKEQGMIDPHGREDYTAIEAAGRAHHQRGLDKIAQYPRDKIEQFTNWESILYYKFFVDDAFPDLDDLAKERMIYNLSRSFTGDYTSHANMFAFEKAGSAGHLVSNFARWKFNRLSRYMDDLTMIGKVHELGYKAVMPFLMSTLMGVMTAGVQGTIGMVEYEALRKIGEKLDLWQMKPLNAILHEMGMKDTWMERGLVTAFSDHTAQQFGHKSGPDISSSIRESSVLEAPTVAIGFAADLAHMVAAIATWGLSKKEVDDFMQKNLPEGFIKHLWTVGQETKFLGLSSDSQKAAIKALPSVMQEAVRHEIVTKKIKDEKGENKNVTQEATKEEGNFIRDQFQENLARFTGIKTTEENRYQEAKTYERHLSKDEQSTLTALKDGISNNLEDDDRVGKNSMIILQRYGQKALLDAFQDIYKHHTEKMMTDAMTLRMQEAISSKDPERIARNWERIRKAMDLTEDDPNINFLRRDPVSTQDRFEMAKVSQALGMGGDSRSIDPNYTPPFDEKAFPTLDGTAIPNLRMLGFTSDGTVEGAAPATGDLDNIYMNTKAEDPAHTGLHEAEHILQRKGLGDPRNINKKFDELVGDKGSARIQLTSDLVKAKVKNHLVKEWGLRDNNFYFSPTGWDEMGHDILYEQFASLAALEHAKGVSADITKDPFLRKHVFNTKEKRQAFRAMTGLRQTRLDSKDLRPYTVVPEKEEASKSKGDQLYESLKKLW